MLTFVVVCLCVVGTFSAPQDAATFGRGEPPSAQNVPMLVPIRKPPNANEASSSRALQDQSLAMFDIPVRPNNNQVSTGGVPSHNTHTRDPKNALILSYDSEIEDNGGYNFSFQTSNGISRSETAELKNRGTENESLSVRGVIAWFDEDGNEYEMRFLADENGFQSLGSKLKNRSIT